MPDTAHPVPSLQVRLNNIDHALVEPSSLDRTTLPRVPVLRIYGISSMGHKACVHVHQVYPYFYVDYRGDMAPKTGKHRRSTSARPAHPNN